MLAKLDERLQDKDMGIELTPAAKVLLADEGLRPGPGCPAAAPDHPARHRGRAVGEDPVRRAQAGLDRPGRHRRRREKDAQFTFVGTPEGHRPGRRAAVEAAASGGSTGPVRSGRRRVAPRLDTCTARRRGPGYRKVSGPFAVPAPVSWPSKPALAVRTGVCGRRFGPGAPVSTAKPGTDGQRQLGWGQPPGAPTRIDSR